MNDALAGAVSEVDRIYSAHARDSATDPYHHVIQEFIDRCTALGPTRTLEIGAREVSGIGRRGLIPGASEYVGFDIHAGPGVDVVGDAHELSRHFPPSRFDAIYSCSVFEHLAFPWKVAMEINRVLRVGGLCYVSTHPTWPPHELPWDFWRFPIAGLKLLFSEPLGFRVLACAEGIPSKLHSLSADPPTRGISHYEMSLGVALIAEKVKDYDSERLRWDVPLSTVLDTIYPNRTGGASGSLTPVE
ncbi:class I SAM-dependent methyltransferase [Lysobacter soli]|uniref:Class I SAM-dependent methyltransferase n=1 Tax=Lysobacter soli TaxID=453783 RepID=A0A3D8VHI0_9GAMM|nr:class I SAM-dependent methyltransferase [Lysobacter soli]RDY68862.1 class I SAM-dependent methyltransferase [Lysobacter soli]